LINNITASCVRTQAKGTEFMFPLANRNTLRMFGLNDQNILAVCSVATRFVRHVLDQVQQNPARLGLPATDVRPAETRALVGTVPMMPDAPGVRLAWPPRDLLATA